MQNNKTKVRHTIDGAGEWYGLTKDCSFSKPKIKKEDKRIQNKKLRNKIKNLKIEGVDY